MEKEYRTSLNLHQCINIVDRRVPCVPPTIQCRYDSGIHEFDRAMTNFSIGLSQELMLYRLINKVRVNRTRSAFSTYTYKQHNGISAYILARKWGIGLYKEKRTLQSTTHDNVISDLKPLTQRYRTDFLSQSIRRLNCRFYTDTLFAKEESIVGNICAQIFTYGEYFK